MKMIFKRKNSNRRLIIVIFSIIMAITLLPISSIALSASGCKFYEVDTISSIASTAPAKNDSTGTFHEIHTASDLNNIRFNLNENYILMNDIVFTETDFAVGGTFNNANQGWNPIGDSPEYPFAGIFDGNGHTIQNLKINIDSTLADVNIYAGLFGCNSGTIKNLGIINENITIKTEKPASHIYAGGIIGYNSTGTVTSCYSTGTVGSITLNDTSLSKSFSHIGGTVGCNVSGSVSSCYSAVNMNITAVEESKAYAGGIVGSNASGTLAECYSLGMITITGTPQLGYYKCKGGIAGENAGTLRNCFYSDIILQGVGSGTGIVTKLTFAEMVQQGSFTGFDFDNTWQIKNDAHYKFPTLKSVTHIEKENDFAQFAGGNGTIYNPYKISTKTQLNSARNYVSSAFVLVNDIEFLQSDFAAGGAYYNGGLGWTPIGVTYDNAFWGIFDGNGYTVKNLMIEASSGAKVAGLFAYNKGTIKNLGMTDGNMKISPFASSVGSVAGWNYGIISNCFNTGEVAKNTVNTQYTNSHAGGIVGNNLGTVSACYNTGSVGSSDNSGGIVGYNSSVVTSCYNTGDIISTEKNMNSQVGGIVGYNNVGTVANCYNSGNVSAANTDSNAFSGGIVGYNYSGTISDCFNTGSVDASLCLPKAGGILGYTYGSGMASNGYGTITACYNKGVVSVSADVPSNGYAGGIIGTYGDYVRVNNCYYYDIIAKGVGDGTEKATKLTLTQMQQQVSFAGFDFDNAWQINSEADYVLPTLKGINYIGSCQYEDFVFTNDSSLNTTKIGDVTYLNGLKITENTVKDLKDSLKNSTDSIEVYKNDVLLSDGELVGTNCAVKIRNTLDNTIFTQATVVLCGDVNGDGVMNDSDCAILQNNVCGCDLQGAYCMAADINGDGCVDGFDLSLIDQSISSMNGLLKYNVSSKQTLDDIRNHFGMNAIVYDAQGNIVTDNAVLLGTETKIVYQKNGITLTQNLIVTEI